MQDRLENRLSHLVPIAVLQVVPIGACGLLQPDFIIHVVVGPQQLPRLALQVHLSGMELG
jgi:hypothetical protein